MLAARVGHQSVVEALIKAGASLDIQENVGVYPIESCVYSNFARVRQLRISLIVSD